MQMTTALLKRLSAGRKSIAVLDVEVNPTA